MKRLPLTLQVFDANKWRPTCCRAAQLIAQRSCAYSSKSLLTSQLTALNKKSKKSSTTPSKLLWPTSALFPLESDRRRQNRLERAAKLMDNDFRSRLDVAEVIDWVIETNPEPFRKVNPAKEVLTDSMRERLRDWDLVTGTEEGGNSVLVRQFSFAGFQDSFLFLARILQRASISEHFPKIEWEEKTVWISLTTYGNTTSKSRQPRGAHFISKSDVNMALVINDIYKEVDEQSSSLAAELSAIDPALKARIDNVAESRSENLLDHLAENVFALKMG
ncbi:uncharacterized protein V2V93DRAFT_368991 [Kockiozyma suomiensis]|uniref:uncharacterized protein n=1 Tax=Kockiozyma suomiensis TaxID=1337062 RepID=UPI003343D82D